MTQDDSVQQADGLSQAEPEVSALRDSIPDAVKLITRRSVVANLPERFAASYEHQKVALWKNSEPISDIVMRLRSLDMGTCGYADIISAMGTDWTELPCDICGERHNDIVARIGEEPDYDARWQDICLPCLEKIGEWVAQAIEARSGETVGLVPKDESAVRKDAP